MLDEQDLLNLARNIINNKIWIKLKLFLDNDRKWYINLNNYILEEWIIINEIKVDEPLLDSDEEAKIIEFCLDGLIDKMNINDDDFYKHCDKINWDRLDEILGYYICIL